MGIRREDRPVPYRCTTRRTLLGAALVPTVAACGSDTVAPEPTGGPGPAASSVAPAAVLTTTAEVPVGGGVVVDGVLVLQLTAGDFTAFNATCPHRGSRVRPPQNGVITCWAHMSRFRETDGARVGGPAERGLTRVAVAVQGDTVVRG